MNSLPHQRTGLLCLIAAIALWSTVEVVVRTVHSDIPPILLAWSRFLIGGAVLLAVLPFELRRRATRLDRRIVVFSLWVAIPGIVISAIAYQFSLKLTGAATVATIYGAAPLFVMALSRLFLGDPFTARRAGGLLCGLAGIAILSLGRPTLHFSFAGVLWAVCAAGAFAFWTVMVKKYAGPFAGLPVTALCAFFGFLYLTPLAVAESPNLDVSPLLNHPWTVLYLGIGGTGLAYWLYFRGLEDVDATRAASVILAKPPTAALLAIVALGEPLTWNLVGAMVLIAAALYTVFGAGLPRVRA